MHDWELTPEVMVAVKVDITVPGRVVYGYDAHDPVGEEQHMTLWVKNSTPPGSIPVRVFPFFSHRVLCAVR